MKTYYVISLNNNEAEFSKITAKNFNNACDIADENNNFTTDTILTNKEAKRFAKFITSKKTK